MQYITRVQISDSGLYDFLIGVGLTPTKSKTIGNLAIPDEFYRDFLRGVFDGDGTIYGFWDKRWKNSLMYYVSFASASMSFLQWLSGKNEKLIGIKPGREKIGIRAWTLTYAKADSRQLFRYMYYHKDLPCLSRKRDKFVDLLGRDPYSIY